MYIRRIINAAFLLFVWFLFFKSLSTSVFHQDGELGRLVFTQHCCFFLAIIVVFIRSKVLLNNIIIPLAVSCCLSLLGEYHELSSVGVAFSIHAAVFPFYWKYLQVGEGSQVLQTIIIFLILNSTKKYINKTTFLTEFPSSLFATGIFCFFDQTGILEREIVSFIVTCAFSFLKDSSINPDCDDAMACILLSISTFIGGIFFPAIVAYIQIPLPGKFSQLFHLLLVSVGLITTFFPASEFLVQKNFIAYVLELVSKELNAIFLASTYWIIIIALSSFFAGVVMDRYKWSRVWGRKVFHIAMVLILVPTLWFQSLIPFSCLSLGGVIYLFSVLEFFRLVVFPEKMAGVSAYFGKFLVAQETLTGEKSVIMAHFSLVLACTIPIWIAAVTNCYVNYPYLVKFGHYLSSLFPFVGVICVGIGDSMAAIVGSSFGREKWPGQRKSYLGSISCFLSLFLSFSLISLILSFQIDFPLLVFACLVTTLGEVCVSGNDNFSLPVIFIFSCMCFHKIVYFNDIKLL